MLHVQHSERDSDKDDRYMYSLFNCEDLVSFLLLFNFTEALLLSGAEIARHGATKCIFPS